MDDYVNRRKVTKLKIFLAKLGIKSARPAVTMLRGARVKINVNGKEIADATNVSYSVGFDSPINVRGDVD